MENQLIKHEAHRPSKGLDAFSSIENFEGAQRMALALSKSTIVPAEYRNNVGNCLVALDVANRTNLSPSMVMQNLYIVNGRPSWASQAIKAIIDNSGRYAKPIMTKTEGTGQNMSCYAYTYDWDGEEVRGITITMDMAKAEGWTSKKGSKWQTMPEVMIKYRAISFFGRLNAPDLLLGIYSAEESEDIGPAEKNKRIEDVKEEVSAEYEAEANTEYMDVEAEFMEEVGQGE